jgi:SHS2 domain-containing protein
MAFRYLPDIALADIAFEADSDTVDGLFESCAMAMTDVMVNPKTLRPAVTREFSVDAEDLDRLLYDFLTELIIAKDVDSLLFSEFQNPPRGGEGGAHRQGTPRAAERREGGHDAHVRGQP